MLDRYIEDGARWDDNATIGLGDEGFLSVDMVQHAESGHPGLPLGSPDHAPATERAYAHDWSHFVAFCGRHSLEALPRRHPRRSRSTSKPLRPAQPLAGREPRRRHRARAPDVATAARAIASRHAVGGLELPTDHPVRKLLRRYSRTRGTAVKKKDALTIERLPAILLAMPDDLPALRDRALLLLGYAGAFRRAEPVAISVADLRFAAKGVYVWIGRQERSAEEGARAVCSTIVGDGVMCSGGARAVA